jgi:hypothetical protein
MQDSTISRAPRASRLVVEVLCAASILGMVALAWVELSRAIGHSYLLADQVDQLQQIGLLVHGDWTGLYGPWWSGTNPIVHALGPLSGLVFGVPARLGLDPDQTHVVFVLLVLASVAAFYAVTSRLDPLLAVLWTSLIVASPSFWWAGSLFWSNTLLVPLGLSFAAGVVRYARHPDADSAVWLVLLVWLGWQIHSTPGVVLLLLVAVAWDLRRRSRAGTVQRRPAWYTLLGLILVVGPYLLAEVLTHGRNTRAIVANLLRRGSREEGMRGAGESFQGTLRMLGLPLHSQDGWTWSVVIGSVVVFALLVLWLHLCVRAIQRWRRKEEGAEDRLALAAVLVLIGHTAFFIAVNRSVASGHYLLFSLPWSVLPVALAMRSLAGRLGRAGPVLVVALSVAVFANGWRQAGNWRETTDWNFRAMSAAMARVCTEHPRIRLSESTHFVPPHPEMEPVLEYLVRRWVPICLVQPDAPVLVHPDRAGAPPGTLRVQDTEWRRVELLPPGLGIYVPARDIP